MRRPNIWVATPTTLAGVAGGIVGYAVADASCAPGSCTAAAVAFAILGAIVSLVGVAVVVVLAVRSVAEWRSAPFDGTDGQHPPEEPETPTC